MKWLNSVFLIFGVATGPSALASQAPNGSVLVEIIEGVPDKANWDFEPTKPSESYTESSFGFAAMPTRYSSKGIKVDRAVPFILRASARVELPKGERKILLRAMNGSRLLMDGQLLLT